MIIKPTYGNMVEHTTCDIPEYYVTFNLSKKPLKNLRTMLLSMINVQALPGRTEELRTSLMDLKELIDMLESVNNAIRYIEGEETANGVQEFLDEVKEVNNEHSK